MPEKTSFSALLRDLLEEKGFTQDQLARELGLTPSFINRLVMGREKPPRLDRVKQIANILKLSPEGYMALKRAAIKERFPEEVKHILEETNRGELREPLPVYIISYAEAGAGKPFEDSGYPTWSGYDSIPRPPDLKDESSYALKVKGDSMSPAIEEGWIVIVAPNAQVRSKDFVVAKDVAENVRLKKVKFDGEIVQLYSVNPAYPPEVYQKKDLIFLHKVYAIIPK